MHAEEARLRAEKEEQERLEQERKQEEIERLELKVKDTYWRIPKVNINSGNEVNEFFLQDSERREGELDELRQLLEKNHTAVTKWKSDVLERDAVSYFE